MTPESTGTESWWDREESIVCLRNRVPVRLSVGDLLLKPVNLRIVYTAAAFERSSPDQIDWDAINQSLRQRWAVDENGACMSSPDADVWSSDESEGD